MPIEWNKAGFVNPNIQITPDKLPVEAMVNVGDALQERYDRSYENYTKAQEALRVMASSAHEADRENAQKIFDTYIPRLKKIAENGRFHDMEWQTLKLAQEAASNLAIVNAKKQQIIAQEEAIAKDPKWQYTKDKRLKEFRAGVSPLNYDPETGIISGTTVTPYSSAADIHPTELAIKYGSLMKPTLYGEKNGNLQYIGIDGKETTNPLEAVQVNHVIDGKITKKLDPSVIQKAVLKALESDPGMKAALERDYGYMEKFGELTGDPKKDALIKQQYYNENYLKPAGVAGDLLRVYEHTKEGDTTMQGPGLKLSLGEGDGETQGGTYEPTSVNIDGNTNLKESLPKVFQKILKGDSTSKIAFYGVIESEIEDLKKEGKTKEAKLLAKQFNDTKDIIDFVEDHPEFKKYLTNSGSFNWTSPNTEDPTGIWDFQEAVGKSNLPDSEKKRVSDKYLPIITPKLSDSNTWEDTYMEDRFENRKSSYFRNVSMQTADLANTKLNNALNSLDLSLDYFKVDPESLPSDVNPRGKVKIEAWSTEPLGGGIGHIFRVRDEKGNVYEVEAGKDVGRSILSQINKYANKSIGRANDFKNYPSSIDQPTSFVDLVKAGKDTYYIPSADKSNKKPRFSLEPSDVIVPNHRNNTTTYSVKRNGQILSLQNANGETVTEFNSLFDLLPSVKYND